MLSIEDVLSLRRAEKPNWAMKVFFKQGIAFIINEGNLVLGLF